MGLLNKPKHGDFVSLLDQKKEENHSFQLFKKWEKFTKLKFISLYNTFLVIFFQDFVDKNYGWVRFFAQWSYLSLKFNLD